MNFDKVFRGYNPQQVDEYIAQNANKEAEFRQAQKERIDQLADENNNLRQQLKQYQMDEQAISKSLVESQRLAQEMKGDAQKFSDLVLDRAKIFYATWHAYSQTLVESLSPDEVQAFAQLQRKIENIINAYEGKDVKNELQAVNAYAQAEAQQVAMTVADVTPSDKTMKMGNYANPIAKVEEASHVIDLKELTQTDQSLEDLCAELGLIKK